jgi:G3E family GTPase
MNNGCICCTVRGDLIRILSGLMKRKDKFDAILVETTGLADPSPVVQTFFVDDDVKEKTRLDSVTTVVDAKHILLRLKDAREAEEQIAFADQIILNKTDLVTKEELARVEKAIRALNPIAPIHHTHRCEIDLEKVLGRNAFDLSRALELEPHLLDADGHEHEHESDIRSVSLSSSLPLNGDKVTAWLQALLQQQGQNILRTKGILDIKGREDRLVFQAVHMVMEGDFQAAWKEGDKRYSRIVFIGRNLDDEELQRGFAACVA